jgi:hypothetical protein
MEPNSVVVARRITLVMIFVLIVEPNSMVVALQTWEDYCRADHGDNSVIVAHLVLKVTEVFNKNFCADRGAKLCDRCTVYVYRVTVLIVEPNSVIVARI